MSECLICGKDCFDKEAKAKSMELIKKAGGLKGEYVNPGGRELIFGFGSVQISDNCYLCDYETLKEELEKHIK